MIVAAPDASKAFVEIVPQFDHGAARVLDPRRKKVPLGTPLVAVMRTLVPISRKSPMPNANGAIAGLAVIRSIVEVVPPRAAAISTSNQRREPTEVLSPRSPFRAV